MSPLLRTVIDKLCLARWSTFSSLTSGFVRIDVEGCDPRLIIVPRIWVERVAGDPGTVATGISWSVFSATKDSKGNLIPLRAVDGASARVLNYAQDPSGIIVQGDNLELQCCTPLIIVATVTDVSGLLASAQQQALWFAMDAFPAEPLCDPVDVAALLHLVRCSQPSAITFQVTA